MELEIDKSIEDVLVKIKELRAYIIPKSIPKKLKTIGVPIENTTSDEVKIGDVTFILSKTAIPGFEEINESFPDRLSELNSTKRSLLDADLIKRYNGGLVLTELFIDPKTKKGKWVLNWKNAKGFNYVERVVTIKI